MERRTLKIAKSCSQKIFLDHPVSSAETLYVRRTLSLSQLRSENPLRKGTFTHEAEVDHKWPYF